MFAEQRRSSLQEEAAKAGHPDPEHATWGEVNVLSLAGMRAGRPPSKEEAELILHIAEFDADFNAP